MKKILIGFIVLVSNFGFAQEWQENFDEAKKIASEQDKNIIIVFSGSDWCAPCIKLDKNIWQSEAFKKEANEEWVLVKANFPLRFSIGNTGTGTDLRLTAWRKASPLP